jgi:hypothetical protein
MVLTRAGPSRWWAAAAALALIAGAPATAFGGARTLPQGTGQLIETLYGWTGFGPPWGGKGQILIIEKRATEVNQRKSLGKLTVAVRGCWGYST